jgi:hypothetical protein
MEVSKQKHIQLLIFELKPKVQLDAIASEI